MAIVIFKRGQILAIVIKKIEEILYLGIHFEEGEEPSLNMSWWF